MNVFRWLFEFPEETYARERVESQLPALIAQLRQTRLWAAEHQARMQRARELQNVQAHEILRWNERRRRARSAREHGRAAAIQELAEEAQLKLSSFQTECDEHREALQELTQSAARQLRHLEAQLLLAAHLGVDTSRYTLPPSVEDMATHARERLAASDACETSPLICSRVSVSVHEAKC